MIKQDTSKADISFFVVRINQLVAELNAATRVTFNPDVEEITRIAKEIKENSEMLKKKVML
jgi:hypothetical protein